MQLKISTSNKKSQNSKIPKSVSFLKLNFRNTLLDSIILNYILFSFSKLELIFLPILDTFLVEEVLARKLINKKMHYKVKWTPTWEPESSLSGCYEILQDFKIRKRIKQQFSRDSKRFKE